MSVSISTIERRIKSGELRACKLGTGLKNAVRIRRSEVERFLTDSETFRDQSAA
jgi:excisionase family DNA binding protein